MTFCQDILPLHITFTLYTFQSSSIGQSTLALALLDLKPIKIYFSYFPIGCVDNRCACYTCILTTCCVVCDSSSFQQYLIGYCLRTGNTLSIWSCQILIFASSGCVPDWLLDCLSKYYYLILAPWACTFALCEYTTTWEILWRKTLYRAKTLVLLYIQWNKNRKIVVFTI